MRPLLVLLAVAGLGLALASASAKPRKAKTQLALDVKPPTALLYIDGRAHGKASAGRVIDVSPGLHVVRLVFGRDEHEEQIKFLEGKTTNYSYEFEEGTPLGGHPSKEGASDLENEPAPSIQPSEKSAGSAQGAPKPDEDPTAGGRWPAEEPPPEKATSPHP